MSTKGMLAEQLGNVLRNRKRADGRADGLIPLVYLAVGRVLLHVCISKCGLGKRFVSSQPLIQQQEAIQIHAKPVLQSSF